MIGERDWTPVPRWRRRVRAGRLAGRRWAGQRVPLLGPMKVTNPASPDLERLIGDHASQIATAMDDPRAGEVFATTMLNTWQTTLRHLPDGPGPTGSVMCITGDIPAMWLRDSSAQMRPFLPLAAESDEVADTIEALIRRQWFFVGLDPYANAFNKGPDGSSWHTADLCDNPWVWEQKYEIDSLAFPIQLAWQFWQVTGRTDVLADVHRGARTVIDLWHRETDHEARSTYRFVRTHCRPTDTLGNNGNGSRVGVTGMTWSGFRPSDDACVYHYNIPAQFFAAHALGLLVEMCEQVFGDAELAASARDLAASIRAGIEQWGVTDDGVLAYEVDGLGHQLVADDANMPSLLSLPLCSDLAADDPLYLATRAAILSERNPYYYQGRAASGIGSPHTPPGYIWHIALAVQGLTSTDSGEKRRLARLCLDTDGGTGLMHEAFHRDDPARFTRPWFSWANSMLDELLMEVRSC